MVPGVAGSWEEEGVSNPSIVNTGPCDTITARSMTCWISRTLPGHLYVLRDSRVELPMRVTDLRCNALYFLAKCLASKGMSFCRSRSDGS